MMKIHLLDMGQTKYGDCILVENNGRRILIDGAHPGDTNQIRTQLKKLFKSNPPFFVDLLVVTHCHSDHIGCLPDLIGLGQLTAKVALVADENLGFGRTVQGDSAIDSAKSSTIQLLIPALQEEDFSDLPDLELEQFIDDAVTLESKYLSMLSMLEQNQTQILRYGRDVVIGDPAQLAALTTFEDMFKDFGLKILGPSLDHLFKCAEIISSATDLFPSETPENLMDTADPSSVLELYRSLTNRIVIDSSLGADRPGLGAAKNNQSIVMKVSDGEWSALLLGDMQLAKAEISGLNLSMSSLLEDISKHGPYDFVKLSHHTSYNGFDQKVLNSFGQTKFYAHTGGRKDSSHPDRDVLDLLENNVDKLFFARTDRNGMITISKDNGSLQMAPSEGFINDFTPNIPVDEPTLPITSQQPMALIEQRQIEPKVNFHTAKEQFVEVLTKVPHTNTKVTITIHVETPLESRNVNEADEPPNIKSIRRLPSLLFLTCSDLLKRNIGELAVSETMSIVSDMGGQLLDIPTNIRRPEHISKLVCERLNKSNFKGVVILGGYDVIPAQRLDVLDAVLRQELIRLNQLGGDADNFIVWSDDLYADVDGDFLPELPISRIPDASSAKTLHSALYAREFSVSTSFGIRNSARPFGDEIFRNIPGSRGGPNISEQFQSRNVLTDAARGAVYYMLHGSDEDGTKFYGETVDGEMILAFSVENVPKSTPGTVVFTGCCWGALTVFERANLSPIDEAITSKSVEDSIALSYLNSGAQAFIGCTGSHYSPMLYPFNYYGKPMHDHFWKAFAGGMKPSEALFKAKIEYLRDMPHGKTDSYSKAIELKILRQYTCLGLGW